MTESDSTFTRSELRILLRVINSRKGADFNEIIEFHKSHRWPDATPEQVRAVLTRLSLLRLVKEQENRYWAAPALQIAFTEACRNCNDTIEEYGILSRILESPLSL